MAAGRFVANHGNKGRPFDFRLALSRADNDNSAEKLVVNACKESRRAQIAFL